MNILNPQNSWLADNLPAGLSLHNGVILGTPTVKGNFSVPVTVSNPLGSDTKNISIITKYRPGFEKFSILQDGVEVDKLTIPELQAMVQDGTAQSRFNCSNTQIVIPVLTPAFKYVRDSKLPYNISQIYETYSLEPSFCDVALNFCSFRDVTLQDNSVRPALILQFDSALWAGYAPFDTGDSTDSFLFSRWKYSNLRQWLNSEGNNWFVPAYDGDALVSYMDKAIANNTVKVGDSSWGRTYNEQDIQSIITYNGWVSSYADQEAVGFLDLLPDDLHSILQPIRIVTQAFFDDQNDNPSIEDPDDVDGFDADITFDKVFLPSVDEMFLAHFYSLSYYQSGSFPSNDPMIEGTAWEFYRSLFGTQNPFKAMGEANNSDWVMNNQTEKISAWGKILQIPRPSGAENLVNSDSTFWITRSANLQSKSDGNWCLGKSYSDMALELSRDQSGIIFPYYSPAPAFAIC